MARQRVDKAQRQVGERPYVEIDHGKLRGAIETGGVPEQSEAGVVDHVLRFEAALAQLVLDPGRGVGAQQVEHENVRPLRACRGDRVGNGVQMQRATGHENELVPALGEDPRERRADPRRGAGDEGDRTPRHGSHFASVRCSRRLLAPTIDRT